MDMTISLPPDIIRKLREVKGDLEAVQRVIIEESASFAPAVLEAIHAPVPTNINRSEQSSDSPRRADGLTDDEFEALLDEFANISPPLPSLPESAITREGMYGDHL